MTPIQVKDAIFNQNLEAIKSATINPAKFFELEKKEGRIKDGYKSMKPGIHLRLELWVV